jgi:hypothetical protein
MPKERMTKEKVTYWFERLCAKLGKLVAKDYNEVGKWKLDHYLGRVNIEEIASTSGGVTHPFGPDRRTLRDMYDVLRFACEAFDVSQKQALVSREVQIFNSAVEGLREFYPDDVFVEAVLAEFRAKVIVPDTGNEQADYEETRRLLEGLICRWMQDHLGQH